MKIASCLLTALLLLAPVAQAFGAGQKLDKQTTPIEKIKIQVAKLGVGAKARGTITTKDGAKIKGYVYRAGDDDFEMRDRTTNNPTTIRYSDVAKVERHHGHSIAKIVLIAVGAGTAITLAAIFGAIASNER